MRPVVALSVCLFGLSAIACLGGDTPPPPTEVSGEQTVELSSTGTPSTATAEHVVAVQDAADGVTAQVTIQDAASAGTATAQVTVTTDKDDVVVPAPSNQAGEYAGSWTGVCQRLNDCGCNPMASVPACARAAETSYTEGMAMARSMGTPSGMLAMMEMTEDKLYLAANSQCATVCSEVSQIMGAVGGAPSNKPSGGMRIDASAGPGGATITIEDDGSW